MAATMAIARGYDNSRMKETHRLGSQTAVAEANTWKTFTKTLVNKDGSGFSEVRRNGVVLNRFDFGPESE